MDLPGASSLALGSRAREREEGREKERKEQEREKRGEKERWRERKKQKREVKKREEKKERRERQPSISRVCARARASKLRLISRGRFLFIEKPTRNGGRKRRLSISPSFARKAEVSVALG